MAIRWKLFLLKTGIRGIKFFLPSNIGASLKLFSLFPVVLFHVKLTTRYLFCCSVFDIFLRERLLPVMQLQISKVSLIIVNQICNYFK